MLKIYLTALITLTSLDAIWLGFIAKSFYKKHLGFLISSTPNWVAIILFYTIFTAALVYFVIQPSLQSKNIWEVVFRASFFGLITYATYDLTNMATIKNWPLIVTIVDVLWGAFVALITTLVVYKLKTLKII